MIKREQHVLRGGEGTINTLPNAYSFGYKYRMIGPAFKVALNVGKYQMPSPPPNALSL